MANKPFFPTLNAIRSARRGELDGYSVAEAFDQMSKVIKQLNDQITGVKPSTTVVQQPKTPSTTGNSGSSTPTPSMGVSFSALTTGTNSGADMIVGPGAALSFAGVGIINASQIQGITVSGTPAVGYILKATSATSASWGALGMITSLDCMSSTGLIGGLDCGSLS